MAPVAPKSAPSPSGSSNRIVAAVIVAIIVLALVVVARNSSSSKDSAAPATSASATPTASAQATATPDASTTPQATASEGHEAPVGIVAHYTPSGATIFWKTPAASMGLANYNVEISIANGPYNLISTVPASQLSLDITKSEAKLWTSFKISTVYEDGTVVGGKEFGLPGTWK